MSGAKSSATGRTGKRKLYHPHRPAKPEKTEWQEKDPKNISPIVKSALRDAMQLERISSVEYDDFLWIIAQESGGIIGARNSKSTARGLFQLLRAQYGLTPTATSPSAMRSKSAKEAFIMQLEGKLQSPIEQCQE